MLLERLAIALCVLHLTQTVPAGCDRYDPSTLSVSTQPTRTWRLAAGPVILHEFWTEADARHALEVAAQYSERCSVGVPSKWQWTEQWLPVRSQLQPSFPERCTPYDPDTLKLERINGMWIVTYSFKRNGRIAGLSSFVDQSEGEIGLLWAKAYRSQCSIGTDVPTVDVPGHIMYYWKR